MYCKEYTFTDHHWICYYLTFPLLDHYILFLDTGSMRTFVSRIISNKLRLKILRKEKLLIFTFGSKTPIQNKNYDVVKIKLENKQG